MGVKRPRGVMARWSAEAGIWLTTAMTQLVHDIALARQPLQEVLALKKRALEAAAEGSTIADARLADEPLIYANAGFERLTGYSAEEVIGRNDDHVQPFRNLAQVNRPCYR